MIDDSDQLRPPEQVDLQDGLAGLGSRFLAMVIDGLIQLALMAAVLIAFGIGAALLAGNARDLVSSRSSVVFGVGIAVALFLTFLLTWGYFIVFELAWSGQTPGKRVAGIRVLTSRGEPVTLLHTLVRNLLRIVDALPTGYLLGALCILLTPRAQRLGDLAAGTVVVRERQAELPRMLQPPAPAEALPPHLASAFSADDVLLARDFLLRAPELLPVKRYELGQHIAAALRTRLRAAGHALPPDLTDDRLLAAVAALRA